MHLATLITRALLVLALLGPATVPTGMMRAQGPDGMRLVICTPDGTREVLLTNDGEVHPVEDHQPDGGGHDGSDCIQISVTGAEAPPRLGAAIRLSLWPTAPPAVTAQRPTAHAPLARHRTRAPPVPV